MNKSTADADASPLLAARFLERALLWTFMAHGLGMLGMLLFLLPGIPGGGVTSDAARVAYIANHPWLWRMGWLPWQLTALSDIALAIALVRTHWIPRVPAYVTLALTCVAVVPDQGGQALWVTRGIALAQQSVQTGNISEYLQFENAALPAISAWAALFYTFAALGWTWCFASARTWNRHLTWLSLVTWSVFLIASIGPLLPGSMRLPAPLVAFGNGVGFVLLQVWVLAVTEQVMRRSRPDARWHQTAWQHPRANGIGRALNVIANSRMLHAVGESLPPIAFDSDITDVIYINYLVEAERVTSLVPAGLKLQRLGLNKDYALFTLLTYRHGNLGPRLLRGARRMLPSPIQTNWRIHVFDPHTQQQGVYFVTNAVSNTLDAIGARLTLEAMPMHVLAQAEISSEANGCMRLRLEPGRGSGPDAAAQLCPTPDRRLPAPWTECFADYDAMLAYCVPQNRVMAAQSWHSRISRQEIRLDIPLTECQPLAGEVHSRAAQAIAGDAAPICFHVPKVAFRFDGQKFDSAA